MFRIGGVVALTGLVCLGCGGPTYQEQMMGQQRRAVYGRLAIVCGPTQGADPAHASMILQQVRATAAGSLTFLRTVDVLQEARVDTSVAPVTIHNIDVSQYDAVLVLVYSLLPSGNPETPWRVVLDMKMIDTKAGSTVWVHEFSTVDADAARRLMRHGHYVPGVLRSKFFCVE